MACLQLNNMENELDRSKTMIRDLNKKISGLKVNIHQHQGVVEVLSGNHFPYN